MLRDDLEGWGRGAVGKRIRRQSIYTHTHVYTHTTMRETDG